MEALQKKVLELFEGKVVRKDLAFMVKGNLPVPTYVLEYLLGQYCASDDEAVIEEGIEKVKSIIKNNYVNRAESEIVKGKIKEAGRYRIIDKVNVVLNDRADIYEASFANLNLQRIPIPGEIVTHNPKLLSGNGVWSIVNLSYDPAIPDPLPWIIEGLKPIQISRVDVEDYISKRSQFSTEEWMDFLVHTIGLNPDVLNEREKMIVLSRLMPHIENNFNFMELGPKGTGKSHVFQELSPYGVLVSGGDVTSARLFSRISGSKEQLGLIGYWDVVAWDEYEHQPGKRVDPVMIDTMQNYLANKSFNRGMGPHEAAASMSFVGNTKHTVEYMLKNSHLFESIPESFIKGAFLDRIHLYNPGWEMKMLRKDSFSKGYGLITDYIAAILHELRNRDFSGMLADYVKFDGSLSERDHNAIRKTFSGMVKLLYPDGNITNAEALKLVEFAAESRKRVKDQLYVIDPTFKAEPAHFCYTVLSNGEEKSVETLERINAGLVNIYEDNEIELPSVTEKPQSIMASDAPVRLTEKHVEYRSGQTGVSYKKMFADYLATASEIVVEDPYIRTFWQLRNFAEFLSMLVETRSVEGLKVILRTWNDNPGKCAEVIDDLNDIQDEMASFGMDFSYKFVESIHDRSINTDKGWKVILGRGLDIFEPYGKFSVAMVQQEKRKCKEFSATYIKDKVIEEELSGGHMKCLAIRQPWATLIAYGIKDVECRNEMVPPCNRFLIAASGTKEPWDILGPEEEAIVREYQDKGILPPYKEWPTSAIIGYVDIDKVTYDPVDSIWAADWPGIKYVLKNAHVFKEPIRGKNKATPFFYNVEGIDEEHMPEEIDIWNPDE